jgi:hypothetical protein
VRDLVVMTGLEVKGIVADPLVQSA